MISDPHLEAQKAEARLYMRDVRQSVEAPAAALKLCEMFPMELARLSPVAGYWPVGGGDRSAAAIGGFGESRA